MSYFTDKIRNFVKNLGVSESAIITGTQIADKIKETTEAAQKQFLDWGRANFGGLYFPLVEFELRKNVILKNTPELTDEHAAAITYFSIMAETPQATTNELLLIPNWSENQTAVEMLSTETSKFEPYGNLPVSSYVENYEVSNPGTAYYYMQNANNLNNTNPEFDARFVAKKNAYLAQVKKLQMYMQKLGLYGGVKKILAEEERQRQSAIASAQEAVKAAAIARARKSSELSQALTSEDRIKTAIELERANKDFEDAQEREEIFKKQLENISKGLDPNFGIDLESGSSLLPFAGLLFGAYLLLKKGKK